MPSTNSGPARWCFESSGPKRSQLPTIMQTSSVVQEFLVKEVAVQGQSMDESLPRIEIGLLTGCKDRPYVFGLAMALGSKDIRTDI